MKTRPHNLQSFAADMTRFRSQSFVIGTVEKWASLGEVQNG